ncbi:PREDICTED: uncharacterized protein LOC109213985 [Nicotiana attenuata]|uniref:uncharacterized protein LOC109213985 n=1 Tax=Nicotiana attenuata TaxID=49451 RepID=UPI000904F1A5|nr:PREDICTED: uncharacterized protein LOC109213985 [Nicotiana attenuata]
MCGILSSLMGLEKDYSHLRKVSNRVIRYLLPCSLLELRFCPGDKHSIKLIKSRIRRYEQASGQKVNNDKSFFVTAPNTSASRINRIRRNSGNSSFWMDNWTGKGALAKVVQGQGKSHKLLVKNFIHEGTWDTNKLVDTIPTHLLDIVTKVDIGNRSLNDFPIWNLAEDGHFNNKSAWDLVETMEHVFNGSEAAKIAWNTIGNPLGIRHQLEPVVGTFKRWWETSSKNRVHNLILQIAPLIICWELWKQRTSCKYGNQKKFQPNMMVHQVIWNIKGAISKIIPRWDNHHPWPDLCQRIEKLKPMQSWSQVLWSTPNQGCIKVNTDGSYIRENNEAGIGGIVRNSNVDLIMAFSRVVQCDNSNTAEALATEFGLKWCKLQGYTNFILELDSMVIANILINKDTNNLKIKQVIERMLHNIQHADVRVMHCYREGNQVANCLANLASTSGNSMTINSYQQLPTCAKGYFLLDKCQIPSIRTKFDKANFFVS